MFIKKLHYLLLTIALVWTPAITCYGSEKNEYMAQPLNRIQDKSWTVSFTWEYNEYMETNFFDGWDVDFERKGSDLITPSGVGIEYKLGENYGVEAVAGYLKIEDDVNDSLEDGDSVYLDMTVSDLMLSLKRYWRVGDLIRIYGGVGADVIYVEGDIDYEYEDKSYELGFTHTLYGGHALIGAEYWLTNIIEKKYPLCLDLQYSYTHFQTKQVDEDLIEAINEDTGASHSSEELDFSGHALSLSLKLHF